MEFLWLPVKAWVVGINRVLLVILDGVGIGALPDAKDYGDEGAHTLRHIAEKANGLRLPNMARLGLGAICDIPGVNIPDPLMGSYGKMNEVSAGKDTTTGHWEIAGLHLKKPFSVFPNGFSKKLIQDFIRETGVKNILGNRAASGTEIIKELGEEHLKTGFPIIYTSADSVFQIACHESLFPLERLYSLCEVARRLCDAHAVGRVIARPFSGTNPQNFSRTPYRKDFSYALPGPTVLDYLNEKSIDVIGIGKIEDIYNKQGVGRSVRAKSNEAGIGAALEEIRRIKKGLVFVNLVDFDQLYGHRNDVVGFAKALQAFDAQLPAIFEALGEDGLLIISADHGNDPTHPGTDHTREYVPLLVFGKHLRHNNLGTRQTFSDVGQTIADIFHTRPLRHGKSFLAEVL